MKMSVRMSVIHLPNRLWMLLPVSAPGDARVVDQNVDLAMAARQMLKKVLQFKNIV